MIHLMSKGDGTAEDLYHSIRAPAKHSSVILPKVWTPEGREGISKVRPTSGSPYFHPHRRPDPEHLQNSSERKETGHGSVGKSAHFVRYLNLTVSVVLRITGLIYSLASVASPSAPTLHYQSLQRFLFSLILKSPKFSLVSGTNDNFEPITTSKCITLYSDTGDLAWSPVGKQLGDRIFVSSAASDLAALPGNHTEILKLSTEALLSGAIRADRWAPGLLLLVTQAASPRGRGENKKTVGWEGREWGQLLYVNENELAVLWACQGLWRVPDAVALGLSAVTPLFAFAASLASLQNHSKAFAVLCVSCAPGMYPAAKGLSSVPQFRAAFGSQGQFSSPAWLLDFTLDSACCVTLHKLWNSSSQSVEVFPLLSDSFISSWKNTSDTIDTIQTNTRCSPPGPLAPLTLLPGPLLCQSVQDFSIFSKTVLKRSPGNPVLSAAASRLQRKAVKFILHLSKSS
ncbi:hypothetical protein MJG53_011669 [Ovis ammon polii x Ovis aries]|uniref:Uncharacterized protein n=1 Tax=Ovis ammon polii x Ovis aries TaxID=2918886 RepID=A0ACB9UPB5_9CETA|nr:hypothetical protein MJG53_011669 [Ovis ammon polii x Ovis aries]